MFSKPRNLALNTTASSSKTSVPIKKLKTATLSKTPNSSKKNEKLGKSRNSKNFDVSKPTKSSVVVQNGRTKEKDDEIPSRVIPKRKSTIETGE